jgi:hypothetical protein
MLNVEGVLRDFLGDARHFYWAPCKYVLVASEEVDELTLKAPNVGGMPGASPEST